MTAGETPGRSTAASRRAANLLSMYGISVALVTAAVLALAVVIRAVRRRSSSESAGTGNGRTLLHYLIFPAR